MRGYLGIIFGAALLLGVGSAGAETYVESIQPYNAALARLCPEKHLETANPGYLNLIVEDFLSKKSKPELALWQRAAQPMCKDGVAGVSCANIAYVRAANKLGKIDELANAACQFRLNP